MDNLQGFFRQLTESAAIDLAQIPDHLWDTAEELRLRKGYPALLISDGREYTISGQTLGKIEQITLNNIINKFLNYSHYAHLEELRQGYVTLEGGHRVGFCGQAVVENGRITTIRDISSINIRFARHIQIRSDTLWNRLLDQQGRFTNTVIASPPGCGKTTLLRSLIRSLSKHGYTVSVCDERNELSGFDLGKRADVMTGCPKEEGMILMLRSMGPQVLATDEIGSAEEVTVLRRGVASGVKLLTTIHASDLKDIVRGPLNSMVIDGSIQRIIFLTDQPKKGTIRSIWNSG